MGRAIWIGAATAAVVMTIAVSTAGGREPKVRCVLGERGTLVVNKR